MGFNKPAKGYSLSGKKLPGKAGPSHSLALINENK
jgi:hypothetical protein